mgnify:CR=1 FL=1
MTGGGLVSVLKLAQPDSRISNDIANIPALLNGEFTLPCRLYLHQDLVISEIVIPVRTNQRETFRPLKSQGF